MVPFGQQREREKEKNKIALKESRDRRGEARLRTHVTGDVAPCAEQHKVEYSSGVRPGRRAACPTSLLACSSGKKVNFIKIF